MLPGKPAPPFTWESEGTFAVQLMSPPPPRGNTLALALAYFHGDRPIRRWHVFHISALFQDLCGTQIQLPDVRSSL